MALGPVLDYWRGRTAKPAPAFRDWSQQELAQFYRVEWALSQAGISVETDRGVSDEGDPWFVFCRASDAEVVIHIAREGDTYLLAGFLSDRIQYGKDFSELVERLLAEHPAKKNDRRGQGNVVMHPATMLALLISIAFLHSNEGRAEAVSADEAGVLRGSAVALPASAGGNLRAAVGLTGSMVALAATFELAQAMTILRVANLMNEGPVEQAGGVEGAASLRTIGDGGWSAQNKRAGVSDAVNVGQQHATEAHASSSLDATAVSAVTTQSGIDHLLEVVAKLWTFPDMSPVAPAGFGVAAALAFFSGADHGADDLSLALRAHQGVLPSGEAPAVSGAIAVAANPVQSAPSATLTIVQTTGSSDSIAQTMLKLSFAGQGDVTIKTDTLTDSSKLLSIVGELVAHAKAEVTTGSTSTSVALTLGHAEVDAKPLAGIGGADKKGLDALTKGAETIQLPTPAEKVPVEEAYTTTIGDGAIKHDVLNKDGQASAERAIAAFKEDVDHYAIAVSGKDVIFYSPDAVINHSSKVVVELWQFKDGSSIALVGLSLDGYLPYSL